jgi:hypothetical protein
MSTYHFTNAFPEEKYSRLPKENLIVFGIYSVTRKKEGCSFERLVKECFTLFPKAFGFSRYSEWPDSLKFDRPLRTLRERGWILGGTKTLFSLTRFGEKVAEETELMLKSPELSGKPTKKPLRGADTALIHFLKDNATFRRFLKDRQSFSITEMELRGILRCTLETPLEVLKQNLQYAKNLANDYNEKEVLDFLEACGQILIEKER